MIRIQEIIELEKGKQKLIFEDGESMQLYRKESHAYGLQKGMEISEALYEELLYEVVGKRAKKRAMHLLERQERTEYQLREKLRQNEYPQEAIKEAIAYVKKYHYLDDMRYACTFVRCQREKRSKRRIEQDLMKRGIAKEIIQEALELEGHEDETESIGRLLVKKGYHSEMEREEAYKIYQFLLRKGYRAEDIRRAMERM
ncbi:MAG: regulatory protein RecX [Lachnospiraceae bacterium]